MDFSQRKRRNLAAGDARQIFLFLFFCTKQKQWLRDTDGLMRGNERGHVSIPTSKQNCGPPVIALRQTEPAIFARHFNSKCADLGQALEIFRRNFTSAIDLVRIDMFAQVTFKLLQKILAGGAIFSALRGIRINSIEIVTPDEKITCETAAVFKRIARSFRELKRFALAFRHFRRVDDGSRRFFRFCAGFFSDLFLRRFERRFHINLSFRA